MRYVWNFSGAPGPSPHVVVLLLLLLDSHKMKCLHGRRTTAVQSSTVSHRAYVQAALESDGSGVGQMLPVPPDDAMAILAGQVNTASLVAK